MAEKYKSIEDYISGIPSDRLPSFEKLRSAIKDNIPEGFVEVLSYNMIGYVVPKDIYPLGYHCNRDLPLPFINIANQGGFIALYHMGIYADSKLLEWFTNEYAKHCKYKLDMGKSCIRFKKIDDIPYGLIGELATKMTPTQWIAMYEKNYLK